MVVRLFTPSRVLVHLLILPEHQYQWSMLLLLVVVVVDLVVVEEVVVVVPVVI
jgi:hypothetical protein